MTTNLFDIHLQISNKTQTAYKLDKGPHNHDTSCFIWTSLGIFEENGEKSLYDTFETRKSIFHTIYEYSRIQRNDIVGQQKFTSFANKKEICL